MKKSFFIIFLFFLGCISKETKIPPDVLSREEMVEVLTEVHILEAKVNKLYLNPDSSHQVYNHYEKMLFADLGVSKETYERSLEFYVKELGELKDIYDTVTDSLLARQKRQEID